MTTRKHRADWAEPWKPKERIRRIKTPYQGISPTAYQVEKRRLQYALLQLQQEVVSYNRRIALVFEGRDAAGKGSTIKRFVEHMMPKYYRIVELGVPTRQESKNWLRRYAVHMPQPCEIVFFDRSWYTRALLEPTMGYCSSSQYKYFVKRALKWEEQFVQRGVEIVKFYLSVDTETQLIRFHERMNDPLKFWKLSENDLRARKKWEVFSKYKEQMFAHTSSELLPWVVVNSNSKREAVLTCMLYLVRLNGMRFTPLTGEMIKTDYEIEFRGVNFRGLTAQQYAVIADLKE